MKEVTIVIPAYNQEKQIEIILSSLSNQTYNRMFDVIIIDDGSSIKLKDFIDIKNYKKFDLSIYTFSSNKGRASARNVGINCTKTKYIIFCDADRIPNESFILSHLEYLKIDRNIISLGTIKDSYYKVEEISNFNKIKSREAIYFKMISNLFDNQTNLTDSKLSWLAFLTGNIAMSYDAVSEERFNEDFKSWGFEHFELGFRLINKGYKIKVNRRAINTHIYHDRSEYSNLINKSYEIFYLIHPCREVHYLKEFINGKISLQKYESLVDGKKNWMKDKNKDIYNKIFDNQIIDRENSANV